jgi:hypothetical protein
MNHPQALHDFVCPECGDDFQRHYIRNPLCLYCQHKATRARKRAGVKCKPQKRYTDRTLKKHRLEAELKKYFKEKNGAK